jgi:hypothetical protein
MSFLCLTSSTFSLHLKNKHCILNSACEALGSWALSPHWSDSLYSDTATFAWRPLHQPRSQLKCHLLRDTCACHLYTLPYSLTVMAQGGLFPSNFFNVKEFIYLYPPPISLDFLWLQHLLQENQNLAVLLPNVCRALSWAQPSVSTQILSALLQCLHNHNRSGTLCHPLLCSIEAQFPVQNRGDNSTYSESDWGVKKIIWA